MYTNCLERHVWEMAGEEVKKSLLFHPGGGIMNKFLFLTFQMFSQTETHRWCLNTMLHWEETSSFPPAPCKAGAVEPGPGQGRRRRREAPGGLSGLSQSLAEIVRGLAIRPLGVAKAVCVVLLPGVH